MLRGMIAGGVWGVLIGGIVLALTSQLADWRDLTPVLTETTIEETPMPENPAQGAPDLPVVVSGADPLRPATQDAPSVPDNRETVVALPAVETAPPGIPSAEATSAPVVGSAPEALQPGDVVASAPDIAPALPAQPEAIAIDREPDADAAPELVETETALTPARLAPAAQATVAEVTAPDPVAGSPAMPDPESGDEVASARPASVPESAVADTLPAVPTTPDAPAFMVAPEIILVEPDAETFPAAPAGEIALDSGDVEFAGAAPLSPQLPGTSDDLPAVIPDDLPPEGGAAVVEPVLPAILPSANTDTSPAFDVSVQPETAPSVSDAAGDIAVAALPDAAPQAPPAPEDAPSAPEIPELAALDIPEAADAEVSVPGAPETPERPAAPEAPGSGTTSVDIPPVQPEAPTPAEAPPEAQPEAGPDPAPARIARIITAGDEAQPTLPGVRIRRLPGTDVGASDAAPAAPEPETPALIQTVDPEAPALERNRVPFERPTGAALVSVVLTHVPGAIPEALPVPMTFLLPGSAAGAGALAKQYREAGHEVVLVPDLPEGGRAQDVAVALSANLEAVSDAVALIDPDGTGFQSSRDAAAQVVATAAETGHGVVTVSRGFNSALRIAERAGVPAVAVLRRLDPGLSDRAAIGRALDQAAFRARTEGRVALVADGTQEMIAAVLAWALENRDSGVVLAPISALLQAE